MADFATLLGDLSSTHPALHDFLRQAHVNRTTSLALRKLDKDFSLYLDGLEELLHYLHSIELHLSNSKGQEVSAVISRIRGDFEAAIEATLGGYYSIAIDRMRDVIEAQLLLMDFEAEPSRIQSWLKASGDSSAKDFRPVKLRVREAGRRGMRVKELPESEDYSAHSRCLHVNPGLPPVGGPGLLNQDSPDLIPIAFALCMWEMFHHATGVLGAAVGILGHLLEAEEDVPEELDYTRKLVRFSDAWRQSRREQAVLGSAGRD